MKVQNIIPIYQQPKIEDMVGQQKQEYPKPSVPPELPNENPVESQDKKEDSTNTTPSLTDGQTLAVKANSVQGKIDAYAAGTGIDRNDNTPDLSNNQFQRTIDDLNQYREIQDKVQKQNGIKEYQSILGMN